MALEVSVGVTPEEIHEWIVHTLRRRGDWVGGVRLEVQPLPPGELPWRPLEGAVFYRIDPIARFSCRASLRLPQRLAEEAHAELERLESAVQRALTGEIEILDGRCQFGQVEGERKLDEDEDGRWVSRTFELSLDVGKD